MRPTVPGASFCWATLPSRENERSVLQLPPPPPVWPPIDTSCSVPAAHAAIVRTPMGPDGTFNREAARSLPASPESGLGGLAARGSPTATQGRARLAQDPVDEAVRAAGRGREFADALTRVVLLAQIRRQLVPVVAGDAPALAELGHVTPPRKAFVGGIP